jgi:uncharacterized protein (TIGR02611 family)
VSRSHHLRTAFSSLRSQAHQRLVTRMIYRTVVLVVGLALLGLGIVLLVFPGPGWPAIILGLVILASEFPVARRVLAPIRRWAHLAAERAKDPAHRKRNIVIGLLLAVAVLAVLLPAVAWYVGRVGIDIPAPGYQLP